AIGGPPPAQQPAPRLRQTVSRHVRAVSLRRPALLRALVWPPRATRLCGHALPAGAGSVRMSAAEGPTTVLVARSVNRSPGVGTSPRVLSRLHHRGRCDAYVDRMTTAIPVARCHSM